MQWTLFVRATKTAAHACQVGQGTATLAAALTADVAGAHQPVPVFLAPLPALPKDLVTCGPGKLLADACTPAILVGALLSMLHALELQSCLSKLGTLHTLQQSYMFAADSKLP